MKLHEITAQSVNKDRRRVGRGGGSGHGKTAGRGTKGQKARTGGTVPAYFEGGQMPLIQRLPKRKGFRRPHRLKVFAVNFTNLAALLQEGKLTLSSLRERGYLASGEHFKILGDGDITTKVEVEVNAISKSAKAKIEAAGGKITII